MIAQPLYTRDNSLCFIKLYHLFLPPSLMGGTPHEAITQHLAFGASGHIRSPYLFPVPQEFPTPNPPYKALRSQAKV
jgi:hypothetical protein